jgi:hypothetical protein
MAECVAADAPGASDHVAEIDSAAVVHDRKRAREVAAVGIAAATHQAETLAEKHSNVAAVAAVASVGGSIVHTQVRDISGRVATSATEQDRAVDSIAATPAVATIAAKKIEAANSDAARAAGDVAEIDQAVIIADRETIVEAVTVGSAAVAPVAVTTMAG